MTLRRLPAALAPLLLSGLFAVGLGACSVLANLDEYVGGPGDAGAADSATDSSRDTAAALDTRVVDAPEDALDAMDSGGDDTTTSETADSTTTDASDAGDSAGGDAADVVEVGDATDTPLDTTGTGSCGTVCGFGVSEMMAHVISGSGDKHEWVELTNYTGGTLDLGGVTVKVFNNSSPPIEKATFTFPAGTTVAAGEAVVVADDDVTFKADVSVGYGLGQVFSFGKPVGDVFINSAFSVRLFASGVTLPYEDAYCSRGTWTLFRSYAYPVPTVTCPSSGRVTGAGALSSFWKDTLVDSTSKYGEFPVGTALYGTPTKSNVGVACP